MKYIYIDSINGVDTNDGLLPITPIKSFKKVAEIVEENDIIRMFGGSVFCPAVKYESDKLVLDEDNSTNQCVENSGNAFDLKGYNLTLECEENYSTLSDKPLMTGLAKVPAEAIQQDAETGLKYIVVEHNHSTVTYEDPANPGKYSRGFVVVDGVKLSMATSLENCQSTPNSFYTEDIIEAKGDFLGSNTITQKGICKTYFNISDGYSLIEIPMYYSTFGIFYGKILNVDIDDSDSSSGVGSIRGFIKNVRFRYGSTHSLLIPYNHVIDCIGEGVFSGFHSYIDSIICSVIYKNCIAKRPEADGYYGFYTHGADSTPNNYTQKLYYYDCVSDGYETAFINTHNNFTVISCAIIKNYATAIAVSGVNGFVADNIFAFNPITATNKINTSVLRGSFFKVTNSGFSGYRVTPSKDGSILKNCTFVARVAEQSVYSEYEVDSNNAVIYENCLFSKDSESLFILGNSNNKRIYKNCYFNINGVLKKDANSQYSTGDYYRIDELMELYPDNYINCKSNVEYIDRKLIDVPNISEGVSSKDADIVSNTYYTFNGTILKLYAKIPKYIRIEQGSVTYCSLVVYGVGTDGKKYGGYVSAYDTFKNDVGVNKEDVLDGGTFGVSVNYKIENDILEITIDKRSTVDNVFNTKGVSELYIRCNEITDNNIFMGNINENNKYMLKENSEPYKMGCGCRL